MQRSPTHNTTILGVVFSAAGVTTDQALVRAWQMWMERLDPTELRGTTLYDSVVHFANGQSAIIIAISGKPASIAYVQEAFAAPDLLAFPGIAPINQRFIIGQALPREQLVLRGHIDNQHRLLIHDAHSLLMSIISLTDWTYALAPTPVRPFTQPVAPPPMDIPEEATRAFQATRLDGATQVMFRLWRPPNIALVQDSSARRRRVLFGLIGTAVILLTVGLITFQVYGKNTSKVTTPPAIIPTSTTAPGVAMIAVAPLAIHADCTPGKVQQFTINNTGTAPLAWSSNGASLQPALSFSAIAGTLQIGESQTILLTTTQSIYQAKTVELTITSNGGNTQITITLGNCPAK